MHAVLPRVLLIVYCFVFQQAVYDVTAESNSVHQETSCSDPLQRLIEEQTSMPKSNMGQGETMVNNQGIQQNAAASEFCEPSFASPFIHQDYLSMLGHNNPVTMRQAMLFANHAPQLPVTDNHVQQLIPSPPAQSSIIRSSKRVLPGSRLVAPYDTASSSTSSGIGPVHSVNGDRQKRFNRTRDALEKSGLMGITMKTADLLKSNESLEKEILKLKKETEILLQSILLNRKNEHTRNNCGLSVNTKKS